MTVATKPETPSTPKPRKPAIAAAAVRVKAGAVSVRVTCYAACRGTITVANGATKLGSGRLVRSKAGVAVVRIPLTQGGPPAGRAAAHAAGAGGGEADGWRHRRPGGHDPRVALPGRAGPSGIR